MTWRTDKPTEKVIVAKLTEDFCHLKDSYAILRLANEPYQHYSEDGEEIPYSAIEKWASLEEKNLPEGLENAAQESADLLQQRQKNYSPAYWCGAYDVFIAGAEYQRKQDQQLIELAEDHAMLAGMNKMKEEMMEKAVEFEVTNVGILQMGDSLTDRGIQAGDKMKIIILKEDENVD